MRRIIAVVGVLVAITGCGGGGGGAITTPSGPTPPPSGWPEGTVVELVSGETRATLAGGQLLVAGAPVTPGTPLATAAPVGATVEVTHAGHLTRQTVVRTGETRLVLWPDTPDYPRAYTKALVYTSTDDGTDAPLRRLPSRVRSVAVSPSPEIQGDAAAMQAHREAAAAMTHPGVGVTYTVGGTADFTVATRIDPGYAPCSERIRAVAPTWYGSSGAITQAEIVFCRAEYARVAGTVAHELGHTFGLRHSSDDYDVMARYYHPGRSAEPTAREILTMALMLQRRPGTVWPDDDRTTQAAAVRFEAVVD